MSRFIEKSSKYQDEIQIQVPHTIEQKAHTLVHPSSE